MRIVTLSPLSSSFISYENEEFIVKICWVYILSKYALRRLLCCGETKNILLKRQSMCTRESVFKLPITTFEFWKCLNNTLNC